MWNIKFTWLHMKLNLLKAGLFPKETLRITSHGFLSLLSEHQENFRWGRWIIIKYQYKRNYNYCHILHSAWNIRKDEKESTKYDIHMHIYTRVHVYITYIHTFFSFRIKYIYKKENNNRDNMIIHMHVQGNSIEESTN